MKKVLLLAASAIAFFTACHTSSQPQEEQTPTLRESLITRIDTLMQHGYMYGHQDDPFYGITWQWEKDRSDTKELVGDYPAVMGFDLGGIEMGDIKNLDSVPFNWIREEAIKHVARGGIITFSWHPRNPRTAGNAWDTSDTLVVRNVLKEGEQHEMFIGWLKNVTDFLISLKSDNGSPIPFIFRPWHEYNGSWFWWGQNLCSDEEFKALWNMTQDYVNQKLNDNVVWAFSPNLQGTWTEEQFLKRYPGDSRVDLVGEDAYQWGTEEDFTYAFSADLTFLSAFAQQHGKPLAVTECGKQNSTIPDWWTRVFKPIADQHQISYFLPWRNWNQEHFGASKDAPTAEDFVKLYQADNTLFLNDIN